MAEHNKKPYKIRTLRADDPDWETFKNNRTKFGKSWNLYIRFINEHFQPNLFNKKKK